MFLNPLKTMHDKEDFVFLYFHIDFYIKKWTPLVVKKRGITNLELIISSTVDHVAKHFNGDYTMLESFVKSTMLEIRPRKNELSIDFYTGEGDDSLIIETLTDSNKISYYDVYKVSKKRHKTYIKSQEDLWVSFIEECEETELEPEDFDAIDVLNTILATPVLQQAYQYKLEELAERSVGMTELKHEYYFRLIVKRLRTIFNGDKELVLGSYKKWLVIYLNHKDLMDNLYTMLTMSHVVPYKKLRVSQKSHDFYVSKGVVLRRKGKKKNIYKFDLTKTIDMIIDTYYDEDSYMSFEIFGVRFYNVLSGVLVTEGDFGVFLRETLIELLLDGSRFSVVTIKGEVVYLSISETESFIFKDYFYFGLGISLVGSLITLDKFNEEIQEREVVSGG